MTVDEINQHDKDASTAILKAFRFLEDAGNQIDALRRTLYGQIEDSAYFRQLGIRCDISYRQPNDEDALDDSGWQCRSTIDLFKIDKADGSDKFVTLMYGAFQFSLAPKDTRADVSFVPHIVLLLRCPNQDKNAKKWKEWEVEEFQLDEKYLTEPDDEDHMCWNKKDDACWEVQNSDCHAIAFVVPLVALKNENDVKERIIKPFIEHVKSMLGARHEFCVF